MESLLPLRESEAGFLRYYSDSGFQTNEHAVTAEELESRLRSAGPEYEKLLHNPHGAYVPTLAEDCFFPAEETVSAVQHLRYMPAVNHASEFFELACVLSGEICCFVEGRKLILKPGDLLILAPHTIHAACTYQDDGIMVNLLVRRSSFEERFLGLLPDSDILKDFFLQALYMAPKTPYLLFRTGDADFLRAHAIPLLRECRDGRRYHNVAQASILSLFFVELLRKHEADVLIPTMKSCGKNRNTVFLLDYLQNNLATITLSELAAYFHYSERQVQRILRAVTGLSFGENVKKLRMLRASALLQRPDVTISDIAEFLGYYDDSSFRHAFKNYYGVSPQEYRAALLQAKEHHVPRTGEVPVASGNQNI